MAKTVKHLTHPDMPDPSVLSRIAERLKRELGAEKVIVYGLVARGEATIDSDIDLFMTVGPDADQIRADLDEARQLVLALFPDEQLA